MFYVRILRGSSINIENKQNCLKHGLFMLRFIAGHNSIIKNNNTQKSNLFLRRLWKK